MQKVAGPSPIARFREVPAPKGFCAFQLPPRITLGGAFVSRDDAEAWAPLIEDIDALISDLQSHDRAIVERFLERAAEAAERQANRLSQDADEVAQDALAVALPALWA
jgi:hypothetical protein